MTALWNRIRTAAVSGRWLSYARLFGILLAAAVGIGLILGLVGTAFHVAVDAAQEFRIENDWIIWLLPAAGVVLVWVYRLCGIRQDKGANAVLEASVHGERIPSRVAPLIFFATAVTHLFGGSAGREGAALQLGGSVAGTLSKAFRLNAAYTRILTMCGMAAAFSALFGTPITAAVFAVGVASAGAVQYAALMPCIVSALCGMFVAQQFGVPPVRYTLLGWPGLTAAALVQVLVLAILCGWLAILFCRTMHASHTLLGRWIKNDFIRVILGGCFVAAVTWLLGTRDYNGAGMDVVARALQGDARPEAFVIKLLLTAVTLAVGFKGGEIVPAFYVGATFGCTAGALLGLNPAFGAAIGLVAVFCGVTNCPIASIVLSVELFGGEGLSPFALAAAISYLLSGYISLYGSQRIVLSKYRLDNSDLPVADEKA